VNTTDQPRAARPLQNGPQCSPNLRVATFEDYEAIAALLRRNGLQMATYEDWKEKFTANPVYREVSGDWPIGWVLESDSGGVVGALGNIPTSYRLGSRSLLAATAGDWAVDEAYRAYSLMLLQRLTKQPNADLLLCTTVSANSERGYRAFDWSKVPVGKWNKSSFWITNYTKFAKNLLRIRRAPLAGALAYPIAGVLFLRERFTDSEESKLSGPMPEVELRHEFDDGFDVFWNLYASEKSEMLLAVRTREMLTWHYRRALKARSLWIVTASRNGCMVGYGVADRSDSADGSVKRTRILDLPILKGHEDVAARILASIIHKCRQDGIELLENTGCWLEGQRNLPITAPSHRTLPSWTFYYKVPDAQLNERLRDASVWGPTSFDGDASI